MRFGLMSVILLHSDYRHVLATRMHLQGGKCKNINIFIVCRKHSSQPFLTYISQSSMFQYLTIILTKIVLF